MDEHGLSTGAPPSFEAIASSPSNPNPPHKNDETATTIMPQSEREIIPLNVSDWDISKRGDLEAARHASKDIQLRWKVVIVIFIVWFSATVIYAVVRHVCMKKKAL